MTTIFCFKVNHKLCFNAKFTGSKKLHRYVVDVICGDIIHIKSFYRLGKIIANTGSVVLTKSMPNGAKLHHFENDVISDKIENISELLDFISNPNKVSQYIPIKLPEELLLESIFGVDIKNPDYNFFYS